MTTDEVIQRIGSILEDYEPGTYENALKMAAFLEDEAEKIREGLREAMSARTD